MCTLCVCVCARVQGDVDRLRELLSSVDFVSMHSHGGDVCVRPAKVTPVSTLAAQLAVLRGVRCVGGHKQMTVRLEGLSVTHEILAGLRGLPEWGAELEFHDCTWPLPAAEYTQHTVCLPHTQSGLSHTRNVSERY